MPPSITLASLSRSWGRPLRPSPVPSTSSGYLGPGPGPICRCKVRGGILDPSGSWPHYRPGTRASRLSRRSPIRRGRLEGSGFKLHHIAFGPTRSPMTGAGSSDSAPIVIEGVGRDGTVPKTFTYQLLENGLIFELLEETFLEDGQRQVDMGCVLGA